MADLKTNYVDDVLDTTKNQLRKYQQIQNDDGTVSFVDVTEYKQVGTSFGAKDINDTNAAINDVNGKLIIKDVAVKALTGYSFIGDAFCENGVTRISGSMSAAATIKTAEWVKFLQIEDPQFYPTHPSQFPCTTHTPGNGAVFAGYINVLTDGGIYVYTRSESIIGSRFFVEFR